GRPIDELLVSGTRQHQIALIGDPGVNYDTQLGLPNPFNVNEFPPLGNMGSGGNYQFSAQNTNAWSSFYGILDDNATKIEGKHDFQFGCRAPTHRGAWLCATRRG